jgi:hypothetical protein
MILKLIKHTTCLDKEDYIYLASDKIFLMEEMFALDGKMERLKFSHTVIDLGGDFFIKVRNPADEICKMIKGKK